MTTKAKPAPKRVSSPDERPPAPWGSAPLAELVILAGIIALAIGVFGGQPTAIGIGIALAGLGGLEVAIRDCLADRVAEARQALVERQREEDENRELVERMLAAPQDFKWVRVSRQDLGLEGCGHWHSRPRLGPIGMLMGWWRVKVSSGCPLPGRLAAVDDQVQTRQAGFRT